MVTELGHQLGVAVVAEGIETDEQRALLTDIGCDALQGFLIARPLTLEHLERWPGELERAA
jgi:EAL domain-containing protein (putative c-di-GMP-specific phosphodiesterase class I)